LLTRDSNDANEAYVPFSTRGGYYATGYEWIRASVRAGRAGRPAPTSSKVAAQGDLVAVAAMMAKG